MENERKLQIINTEVEEEFGIKAEYIKIRCTECGNSWGISLRDKESGIGVRDFLCERCMAEKYMELKGEENYQ